MSIDYTMRFCADQGEQLARAARSGNLYAAQEAAMAVLAAIQDAEAPELDDGGPELELCPDCAGDARGCALCAGRGLVEGWSPEAILRQDG